MAALVVLRNASRRLVSSPLIILPRKRTSNACWLSSSTSSSRDCNSSDAPNAIQVPPPPSWSVSELRLSSTDDTKPDKISEEELAVLARRCLIDVRHLSAERRDQLRVDVAGIMRCASVLLDSKNLGIDGDMNNPDGALTDQEIYDNPRGLGRMPVRRNSDWQLKGSKESKAIMNMKSVKTKMVIKDDEKFFEVVTKR